jgi:hypothetical protein
MESEIHTIARRLHIDIDSKTIEYTLNSIQLNRCFVVPNWKEIRSGTVSSPRYFFFFICEMF